MKIRDTDYLYATARLRALEKNMLTARDFEKMVDASSFEESFRVANETSLHSRCSAKDYETAIAGMLEETYALIAELTDSSPIFDIFRFKYDGHNLKVIIKAQAIGRDPLGSMSPLGVIEPRALSAMFQDKKIEGLPERMAEAAYAASEALAKSNDPQLVDLMLDTAVMQSMLERAEETEFPFLIDVVRRMIDTENLRTAVRIKRMGKDEALLRRVLTEGGYLDLGRLCEAFRAQGFEAMRDMLFVTDYSAHFAPLLDDVGENRPLTAFERGADNYLMLRLRSTRLVAFGLEPVISYLLAKEAEAKQVRIILASRLAGVPKEKISERMRETYA